MFFPADSMDLLVIHTQALAPEHGRDPQVPEALTLACN